MRNCLILGCGRSGTSMLAGTLAGAGYYMGGRLYKARKANPKGFFESLPINAINEHLLKPVAPSRSNRFYMRIWRTSFPSERWLAELPVDASPAHPSPRLCRRIRHHLAQRPFAFKDPRFCYTLPAWRPLLPRDTAFLCIFREPGRTVASILKECRTLYPDIPLTENDAYRVWLAMYGHVLERHRHEGDWLFVHYDQVLDGSAHARIESHLGTRIDHRFPDARLKRSTVQPAPPHVLSTYKTLCKLARYPH